ncbi:MAG: secretin N-terminal domain-containing protein, partial [Vicinamibacteria bacterium]
AERRREYDRAVLEYARALKLSPENVQYQRSLDRARLRAAEEHAALARRLSARGLHKDATEEMRLAVDLQPGAASLLAELRQMEALRQTGAPTPTMQEVKERARERSLPGLVLGPAAREPLGLSFRSTSLRDAYLALGKAAGVNFVFDPQFQDTTVSLDLADVAFEQALSALAASGRTFHHVTDAQVVTVVPDTPTKRREYEQQVVKTFFLSNADLKETIDLLRIVLGARRVAPLPGSNALTISDTPDKVAAAERILGVLDKERAEVLVEIEILEVNRTRLKEFGIEITSAIQGLDGIAGAIFPDPTRTYTLDDNPYSKDSLVISQLPGVIYRLLKTDGSTRLLANPQLRTTEGQTAQARFGDQVPVPVTVFTPLAQGGVAQQPVTSFEYKSVGVNIDVTPRVHHDGDVSLGLKLEISSLGALFQNNPTFRSRNVNSVLRLRDGETTILAGLIQDEERLSATGIPGLSDLPVLGHLFTRSRKEVTETDIVMTMTPHVLRRPSITEQDLRSFSVGGEAAPLLFEVPGVPPIVPAPARTVEPPRIEPIRPPVPTPTPAPENR